METMNIVLWMPFEVKDLDTSLFLELLECGHDGMDSLAPSLLCPLSGSGIPLCLRRCLVISLRGMCHLRLLHRVNRRIWRRLIFRRQLGPLGIVRLVHHSSSENN